MAILVAAVLPSGLVAAFNAGFILDHFYARPPYLLDSGWLSAIVYRSGAVLQNPASLAHYGRTFYSVHVSPLMSLFSALSYLVPLDRVAWYALFQAGVYAPLGLVGYFASLRPRHSPMWRLSLTAFTALTFAFCGQSMIAIQYPHFEVAVAGFGCLLLACVATRRRALMWPLLVLTLSVREDAGFHVACALAPLLYLNRRGRGDSATRRDVVQLIGFAVGWSALAFAVQKVFLSPPPAAWRMAFFGKPLFFHISAAALRERVEWLATGCSHITVPFVATVILACARRDARYLLGWFAATPWLVANLLAFEDAKWRLSAYVGFPFLISVFWGYLYGGVLAPPGRRLTRTAADLFFAAAFLTSTGAVYLQYPHLVRLVVRGSLRMDPASPEQVDAYARAINGRGTALGRLAVDAPVAALAIETLPRGGGFDPGKLEIDTVAFHREGNVDAASLLLGFSANGIVHCAHVLATGYYLCSRLDGATDRLLGVRTEAVPPLLVFANFDVGGRRIEFAPEGVAIGRSSAPGLTIASFAMSLRAGGSYEVVWDLAVDAATEPSGRTTIATVDVVVDQQVVGDGAAVAGDGLVQRIVVPFSVGANKAFSARLWYHGPAGLVVRSAQLRAASPR